MLRHRLLTPPPPSLSFYQRTLNGVAAVRWHLHRTHLEPELPNKLFKCVSASILHFISASSLKCRSFSSLVWPLIELVRPMLCWQHHATTSRGGDGNGSGAAGTAWHASSQAPTHMYYGCTHLYICTYTKGSIRTHAHTLPHAQKHFHHTQSDT